MEEAAENQIIDLEIIHIFPEFEKNLLVKK